MIIKREVDLYKYSTMRTHSIGKVLYIPENLDELIKLLKELGKDCYFIGGGSNVLFAKRVETPIVNLMEINKGIIYNNDNMVTAGCSVRIQELINYGKRNGLGGFEYLYSLPASVGGVIYMNAGRGVSYHQQISDWIESVKYLDLDDMKVKKMVVKKQQWKYRYSPFHQMNAVILSASFIMQKMTEEEINNRIRERKDTVKLNQEGNKPSCGSVFCKKNGIIMRCLRGIRVGGACYSKKTSNWISNDQNGSADDVLSLINLAKIIHNLTFQKCILEIKIMK